MKHKLSPDPLKMHNPVTFIHHRRCLPWRKPQQPFHIFSSQAMASALPLSVDLPLWVCHSNETMQPMVCVQWHSLSVNVFKGHSLPASTRCSSSWRAVTGIYRDFFSSLMHWFDCSHLWAVENRAACEHTGSVCLSPFRLWEGWSWNCWVLGTWALFCNGDGVSILTVLQPEQLELLKTRQCLLSAESL